MASPEIEAWAAPQAQLSDVLALSHLVASCRSYSDVFRLHWKLAGVDSLVAGRSTCQRRLDFAEPQSAIATLAARVARRGKAVAGVPSRLSGRLGSTGLRAPDELDRFGLRPYAASFEACRCYRFAQ